MVSNLECAHPHNEGFHRGLLSRRGPLVRRASLAGHRSSCLSLPSGFFLFFFFSSFCWMRPLLDADPSSLFLTVMRLLLRSCGVPSAECCVELFILHLSPQVRLLEVGLRHVLALLRVIVWIIFTVCALWPPPENSLTSHRQEVCRVSALHLRRLAGRTLCIFFCTEITRSSCNWACQCLDTRAETDDRTPILVRGLDLDDVCELFGMSFHFECLSQSVTMHACSTGGPTQTHLSGLLLQLFLCTG